MYLSIVERVFSQGPQGWSVALTQKTAHPREYSSIAQFLGSSGPLLAACNRLLSDPYVRFDFPRVETVARDEESAGGGPAVALLGYKAGRQPLVRHHGGNVEERYAHRVLAHSVRPEQVRV